MKICFLNRERNYGRFGGDLVLIDALAEALRERGHDVHVGDLQEEPEQFAMSSDIIHINNLQQEWARTFTTFFKDKKPIVLTPFYLPETDSTMIPEKEQSVICDHAQAIIVTGEMELTLMNACLNLGKNLDKIHLIPNGARSMFYREGKETKESFILAVGRIEERKNFVLLAEATKNLGVPLVIVGTLPNKYWTKEFQILQKLQLYPHVKFTGYLSDDELIETYKRARVVAQCSLAETDSQTPYEAVLSGCNVLLSDTTQAGRDDSPLLQFSSVMTAKRYDSPESIALKLTTLLNMENDGKAKEWVLNNRTWGVLAKEYEKIYQQLL